MKARQAQDIVEWTLIVALVSVVVMGALFALAPTMKQTSDTIINAMQNVNNQ